MRSAIVTAGLTIVLIVGILPLVMLAIGPVFAIAATLAMGAIVWGAAGILTIERAARRIATTEEN